MSGKQEMKDSGVEWIGEIPANWIVKKIKNAVSVIGSGTTPPSNIWEYYNNGSIYWIQSGDIYGHPTIKDTSVYITEKAITNIPALQVYTADYIVMAMYGGSVGNISIAKIDACTNQACCVIKPSNMNDLKFMFYWMLFCRDDFLTKAIGGGQPNISQFKIRNQYFLQPPFSVQCTISNYLDRKCTEIDSLTNDIETQIETLEQYKRSVITEAVTKGLNPDVEMKDSGIEWVGSVPKSWDVKPIRAVFEEVTKKNKQGLIKTALKFTYGTIVRKTDFDADEDSYVADAILNYTIVEPGTIMLNGLNLNYDFISQRIGLVTETGVITSAYMALKVKDDSYIKPEYATYLFKSYDGCKAFHNMGGGVRKILNFQEFQRYYVLIPPVQEQNTIISYLDAKCAEIDSIIADEQTQLETLTEYKKSLIYEYVTGKKEVPTA